MNEYCIVLILNQNILSSKNKAVSCRLQILINLKFPFLYGNKNLTHIFITFFKFF